MLTNKHFLALLLVGAVSGLNAMESAVPAAPDLSNQQSAVNATQSYWQKVTGKMYSAGGAFHGFVEKLGSPLAFIDKSVGYVGDKVGLKQEEGQEAVGYKLKARALLSKVWAYPRAGLTALLAYCAVTNDKVQEKAPELVGAVADKVKRTVGLGSDDSRCCTWDDADEA